MEDVVVVELLEDRVRVCGLDLIRLTPLPNQLEDGGLFRKVIEDLLVDAAEQEQIIGTLSQQGLDAGAEEFLANELNNPASIDELSAGVTNQTEALQLYTAARVSIEPDTSAEQQFLAVLADRLGITPDLRAHVDAAARGMV